MKTNKAENTSPESVENDTQKAPETATTMDALVSGETMPEIQEHAIAAFNDKAAQDKAEADKLAAQGVKLNKDGSVAKRRGRKSNAEKAQLNDPRAVKAPTPEQLQAQDSMQAALVVSGLLEQMQVVLISDEFKYEEMERAGNVEAWRKTFDYYGGVKLSPPAELAMSHASIILARAMRPQSKTQEKLSYAKVYFKNMFAKIGGKLKKQKPEEKEESADENARIDNRANDERKDNVRNQKGASPKK